MNKKYYGDYRYEKIYEQMQLLGIQDVSTKRQEKNGTTVWQLPVRCRYGGAIHVASFASGYVRRTKAGGYCPSWQINKRIDTDPEYFNSGSVDSLGRPMYTKFTTKGCKLIPIEIDRLEYLIRFCLKNYYIGYANMLSSGEFIPKWKYDEAIKLGQENARNAIAENCTPEVKVIVNGHRYNVI